MRRILLVRHGESQGNIDPLAYGRIGDPHIGLTEEGWRQVFKTGDFLRDFYREHSYEGRPYPQAVDTSTWIRAVQTEEAVTRYFSGNPDIICRRNEALKEQSFGLLYREHTRCSTSLKSRLRAAARAYQKNPFEAVPPDGESPAMHYARIESVAREILSNPGIRDRLVVAHGATNKHIITMALGMPAAAWKQIENQNNGDVTLLEDLGHGFTVRKIYDGVSGRIVNHNPVKAVRLAGPTSP